MGNLIVHKKGSGPKVMFAAHMDSIGLIVTHIDEAGYLSFGKLGGVRPEDILHTPFRFKNGVCGVVSLRKDVALKDMTIADLYLDIGARNAAHARHLVRVGDTAVSRMPAFTTETRLVAPYLDNRISCAVMLDALSHIRTYTSDCLLYTSILPGVLLWVYGFLFLALDSWRNTPLEYPPKRRMQSPLPKKMPAV